MTANPSYIGVTSGMSGYFAVLYHWNTESGGFYEPYNTGIGRYAFKEDAVAEARFWAEDEGLEFKG